jgi:hypothetical protein
MTQGQLEYAPRPPLHHRQSFRWLVIAAVLLPLVPMAILLARRVYPYFLSDRRFAATASYSSPPLIYTEDSTERATLRAQSDATSYANVATYLRCRPWQDLKMLVWGDPSASVTLFAHERRTPAGDRLVIIELGDIKRNAFATHGQFDMYVIRRGSFTAYPTRQPEHVDFRIGWGGGPIRFTASSLDPSDGSHFVINYTAGGAAGVLDGWLKEDDTIELERREEVLPATTAPAPPSPGKSR